MTIYDTGDHRIGGASQQQGGGSSLSFSTDRGSVGIEAFAELRAPDDRPSSASASASASAEPIIEQSAAYRPTASLETAAAASTTREPAPDAARATAEPSAPPPVRIEGGDPFDTIRKLARLKDEGLLTDEEFAAKKTELLARI
ncbi:SHOCT domain-containing protein [Chenggangzhangella methanolivorans]|uniref:SHOCT domain-containing protein n=1 Tax=Chenggangzhangella methanolivorans TaxID=1437009 RepID=UPI0028F40DF1|nr:SHOCT domain-containing protein [Chenggangzhangella methanolivorans]